MAAGPSIGKGRAGPGRPPGTPNKATAEIKALAQQHTAAAMAELARIAVKGKSEQARVAAIRELFDRGYGKATQPLQHEGANGGDIGVVHRVVVEFGAPGTNDPDQPPA